MRKLKPKDSRYYDLIRIPHGHIPAPMANFWSSFPIPIKEKRGWDYYYCPMCGSGSFFKVDVACWCCQYDFDYNFLHRVYEKKRRHDYFRRLWKKLEYLFLPILVLIGKAWYVRSERRHLNDFG